MTFLQLFNLFEIIQYISTAPFFWSTMGIVTGIGMFVGSIIYNGDVKGIIKAVISLLFYIALLLSTSITRIYKVYCEVGFDSPTYAFSGMVTSIIVSLFYVTGMFAGVWITRQVRLNRIKKQR